MYNLISHLNYSARLLAMFLKMIFFYITNEFCNVSENATNLLKCRKKFVIIL